MKLNAKLGDEFKELESFSKELDEMARANIGIKFMNAIVTRCDNVTKDNTPVREEGGGTLRNSWKWRKRGTVENLEIDYYNGTDYAPYVEYGHRTRNHKSWVTGRFMLRKGINAVKRDRTRIAKSIINKAYKAGKK